MENKYKVLDSHNLGIELEGETAKRFRAHELLTKEYYTLREQLDKIVNDRVKLDFIGGSRLLFSAGYWAASSCSVYMDTHQRDFFSGQNWEGKRTPLAFGANEGNLIYVAHNADTKFIKENLIKLWESWFEFVSKLKE